MTFQNSTIAVMNGINNGSAFDQSLLTDISVLISNISIISNGYPNDYTSLSIDLIDNLTTSNNMIFKIIDNVSIFSSHVSEQYNSLSDNLSFISSSIDNTEEPPIGDFFGSIVETGPSLVAEISPLVSILADRVDDFGVNYTNLQNGIIDTKTNLLSILADQISDEDDINIINAINILIDNVNDNFSSGDDFERSTILAQIINEIVALGPSGIDRGETIQEMLSSLNLLDNQVFSDATSIRDGIDNILPLSISLVEISDSEKERIDNVIEQLTQLSQASSLQSLFRNDVFAQTLLGYVATDEFLGNLGEEFQ